MTIEDTYQKPLWYAVMTRSRQEKVATSTLESMRVETFLPVLEQQRIWSDRKRTLTVPLFSGYVFVRIVKSGEDLLRVLKVPGIVNFVRSKEGPLPIPDIEIASIRTVLARGARCSASPFLEAGSRVRVIRGILSGIEGTILRNGQQSTLIISIEMIRRSVAVTVAETDVELVAFSAQFDPVMRGQGAECA